MGTKKQSIPVVLDNIPVDTEPKSYPAEWSEWSDWSCHHALRFVARDERKILQQKWLRYRDRDTGPALADYEDQEEVEWRDVPLVVDV
jgi:hypothetical protein